MLDSNRAYNQRRRVTCAATTSAMEDCEIHAQRAPGSKDSPKSHYSDPRFVSERAFGTTVGIAMLLLWD